MQRRDGDEKREKEVKVEESSNPNFDSKVRCKGELVLLAPLKRGGPGETPTSTPVVPWRHRAGGGVREIAVVGESGIPARRLAAAVWEFVQFFSPIGAMEFGEDEHRQQRRHSHYLHHRHHMDKGIGGIDSGGPSHHQPATASSLRHQVATLLAQHHRFNRLPPQPQSPASSLEIQAYDQASTPTSSADFKGGRPGQPSSSGFKTSTELLKVLNRIWTLEEQNVSNISLIKDLKTELNHAHLRIKELLRDHKSSRHEIEELIKQAARGIEHERSVHATVSSLKNELEDERKLRKRSEGLHRRLAREIFEAKVALSGSVKQVERERTGRCLLEDLCDEFAKGIIEYEHVLRQKNTSGVSDRLMVQMSESWLDERLQMKDQGDVPQLVVVDKIRDEIDNFLEARKNERRARRSSLESYPLTPGYAGDEGSVNTKNAVSEIKSTLPQEKGVTEVVDKPVGELLVTESGLKDSLKAKLQEPKARGGYRSRLKILKGSS